MQPKLRERRVDGIGQSSKVVQDVGKGADVQDFLDQLGQDMLFAIQTPEQGGDRDIDRDQQTGQVTDVTFKKAESAVDVSDKGRQKAIDDIEIVHRFPPPLT